MTFAATVVCLVLAGTVVAQGAGLAQGAAPAPDAAALTQAAPAPFSSQEAALAPAGAALPYSSPGHSLRPIRGIVYSPDPSDFTSYNQGGPYPATGGDFENSNFPALWGSAGRNDSADLKSMNVNALRMYEFKGYYSHVSFLNAAYSAGMKVMVPLSNAEILASSSAQYINTTVQETVNNPANMAWGLSNELSFDSSCQPLSKCFPKLIAAAQQIASMDTSSRPIVITSIFDANFATAASVKQAFVSAGQRTLYNTRVMQGINMYFSENSSQLPGILANVLSGYFNNSNLKSSPLIVTEYGRQSGSPYSLTEQAYAVGNETKALYGFARGTQYPLFLGSFLFQYSDSNLNGGSTFGIKTFGSSSYEANGGAGTYKVDSLTNKPEYTAFKQALAS